MQLHLYDKTVPNPRVHSPYRRKLFVLAQQRFPRSRRGQYSTKRSRVLFGYVGKQWEQRLIATLGSALNRWLESVPEHRETPRCLRYLITSPRSRF